MEIVKVKKGI